MPGATVLKRVKPANVIMPKEALDGAAPEFTKIIVEPDDQSRPPRLVDRFVIEPWFVESPAYAATRAKALTFAQRLRIRWARRPTLGRFLHELNAGAGIRAGGGEVVPIAGASRRRYR